MAILPETPGRIEAITAGAGGPRRGSDQDFGRSLKAFTAQRRDLLAQLEPRLPRAWSRGATMLGAGAPLEVTIHDYADRMARHERPHVKQIQQTIDAVRRDG
jgi:hypothetical protein